MVSWRCKATGTRREKLAWGQRCGSSGNLPDLKAAQRAALGMWEVPYFCSRACCWFCGSKLGPCWDAHIAVPVHRTGFWAGSSHWLVDNHWPQDRPSNQFLYSQQTWGFELHFDANSRGPADGAGGDPKLYQHIPVFPVFIQVWSRRCFFCWWLH